MIQSDKKKLLFVAPLPPPMGGVEHAMEQLLNSNLTHRFDIIHINSRIRESNINRGYINFSGIMKLLSIGYKLILNVLKNRPKYAYFPISSNKTGFARDGFLILLAKTFGMKIVVHYRGGNFDNFYNYSSWFGKSLIRFVFFRVDMLIVLGHSIVKTFKGIFPERKEIKIVPNGINLEEFSHCSSHRDSNTKSSFTILYIGNLSFVKGFYDLVLVYKRLFESYPHIRLFCAGEVVSMDKERNILCKYFSEEIRKRMDRSADEIQLFLKQSERYNTTYLGVIDKQQKKKILSEASVFVLPSYSEGFSMGVLEAMAAGLPVISTNVGAMSEVIKNSENGFILEPGDFESLYNKLTYLIENNDLCEKMGKNSIEIVKGYFDIEQIADRLGDIFDLAIDTSRLDIAEKTTES